MRGQVFTTTGLFADYVQEDWGNVGSNRYDVSAHHLAKVLADVKARGDAAVREPWRVAAAPEPCVHS